jgi:hypothetical protein
MNFTAYKVSVNGRDITFHTNATPYFLNQALELKGKIKVSAKPFKESKTQRQNNYIWAMFSKISLEVNGSKRKEDVERVYRDCLVNANVVHEQLIAPKGSKDILERAYSVVIEGEIKNDYQIFDCFLGISKLDTTEMSALIDSTIDYGVKCGIAYQELDSMKGAYDL